MAYKILVKPILPCSPDKVPPNVSAYLIIFSINSFFCSYNSNSDKFIFKIFVRIFPSPNTIAQTYNRLVEILSKNTKNLRIESGGTVISSERLHIEYVDNASETPLRTFQKSSGSLVYN